jgi:glc operon protein GlcG
MSTFITRVVGVAGFLLLATGAHASAQVASKQSLTLDGARRIIAAAKQEARRNNEGGVIAVVDDGGNLIALERLDETFAAGAKISIGKARTAALFKRPTRAFEDIIKNGRTAMVALEDFTPLQGGVPVIVGGQVVGAVGVSGAASAQRDEEVAMAGVRALGDASAAGGAAAGAHEAGAREAGGGDVFQAGRPTVSYWAPDAVRTAFSKGSVLLDDANGSRNYMVHASHRDGPGMAEVHGVDTDIIYVLNGTATIVTGGTLTTPKTTAPNEIRGAGIEGGKEQRLSRGAVLVVPSGVPHWFRQVDGAFDYFVVKVR